jgi:c-di-GMP-binding flagellar brake protein YcgR
MRAVVKKTVGVYMLLSIGTIIVIDQDFTKDSEKFKSKVVDMGGDFIMIDYPTHIETGRTAFFLDGVQLHITFTDNQKISYAFETEVIGRLNKGIPMLKLKYPGDDQLIKIQRREFVRVEYAIDVAIQKEGLYSQYVAEDLSAGGIAIRISEKENFQPGEMLPLLIVLPFVNQDIKYVRAEASVVRTWEKNGRNIVSLKFEEIGQSERQAIIRFCFERQLQLRNME